MYRVVKKKTAPLKNCNNFVTGEYILFKIYTHVVEIFLHIPAKFCEEISNRTKYMVGQKKSSNLEKNGLKLSETCS